MDGTTPITEKSPAPPMAPGKAIELYIKLRERVDAIKKAQAAQLAPFSEAMAKLEANLLSHLNDTKTDSAKCEAGTAFKSTVTSVGVKEWAATLAYIKEHELWDLLEARVSKTAAQERIEEAGEAIPGVSITQAVVLRVRRS